MEPYVKFTDQTSSVTVLPIDKIAADHKINSRVINREDGIKDLAGNIKAMGLLQPLLVRLNGDGSYHIVDGNRRFAALKQLSKQEGWEDGIPVRVLPADDKDAQGMSLAANIMRVNLHPVDQYKAFVSLHNQGIETKEIARRFSVSIKEIEKYLALGTLIPKAMKEWENNRIDLTSAMYLSSASPERQAQALKDSAHITNVNHRNGVIGRNLHERIVKSGDKRIAAIGGITKYYEAGGKIETNLFNDEVVLVNPEIVQALVQAAREQLMATLIADGWDKVIFIEESPEGWFYKWQKIKGEINATKAQTEEIKKLEKKLLAAKKNEEKDNYIEQDNEEQTSWDVQEEILKAEESLPRKYTDKQKKEGIAVVNENCEVIFMQKKKEENNLDLKKKKVKPKPGDVSAALVADLNQNLTQAVRLAVQEHKVTAEDLLLLALLDRDKHEWHSLGDRNITYNQNRSKEEQELLKESNLAKGTISQRMVNIRKLKEPKRLQLLSAIVASLITTTSASSELCKFMADKMDPHKTWAKSKEFFERLTTAQLLEVFKECKINAPASIKKTGLVTLAMKNVPATWLPHALRISKVE